MEEKKRGGGVILVLVAVIVVLLAAVVYLLLRPGKADPAGQGGVGLTVDQNAGTFAAVEPEYSGSVFKTKFRPLFNESEGYVIPLTLCHISIEY